MMNVNFLEYKKSITKFLKKKNIRYGIPFMLFCIAGSFGFSQVTEVRYKYRSVTSVREEVKREGIPLKNLEEVSLEAQYEKLHNQVDIDNWKNKRISRPWEEGAEENVNKN